MMVSTESLISPTLPEIRPAGSFNAASITCVAKINFAAMLGCCSVLQNLRRTQRMDGAFALGAVRPDRCHGFPDSCSIQPRRPGIDNRRARLANKCRHDRKRSPHRNRSALCVSLCARICLLAQLLGTETISLVDLVGPLDLSWARLAGKGSAPSFIFLRDRFGHSVARRATA